MAGGEEPSIDLRHNPLSDVLLYSSSEAFVTNRPLFEHQLQLDSDAIRLDSSIHPSHAASHRLAQQTLISQFYDLRAGEGAKPQSPLATTLYEYVWHLSLASTSSACTSLFIMLFRNKELQWVFSLVIAFVCRHGIQHCNSRRN